MFAISESFYDVNKLLMIFQKNDDFHLAIFCNSVGLSFVWSNTCLFIILFTCFVIVGQIFGNGPPKGKCLGVSLQA